VVSLPLCSVCMVALISSIALYFIDVYSCIFLSLYALISTRDTTNLDHPTM
jgi:hypothetical protein